jgi:hypothetical protein
MSSFGKRGRPRKVPTGTIATRVPETVYKEVVSIADRENRTICYISAVLIEAGLKSRAAQLKEKS